jgi:MoxR-like ATPase
MSRDALMIMSMGSASAIIATAIDDGAAADTDKLGACRWLALAINSHRMTLDEVRYAIERHQRNPAPAAVATGAAAAVASRAEQLALSTAKNLVVCEQKVDAVMTDIANIRNSRDADRKIVERELGNISQTLTVSVDAIQHDLARAEATAGQSLAAAFGAERAAVAAAQAAAQAAAAAGAFKPDAQAVALAVADAVAQAFKPFAAAVADAGAEAIVSGLVANRIIGNGSALALFGVDVRARGGKPVMFDLWGSAEAPAVDPCFIWTENILRHLALSQSTGESIWLTGERGTGKSETVRQWCAGTKRPYCRINFTKYSSPEEFIGATGLVNGATVFVPGAFLAAYTTPGTVILLDEVTNADPGNLAILNALLEPHAAVNIGGTVWRRAAGVVVIAADNTAGNGDTGRYAGTRPMNSALVDRFARMVRFDYLPLADETAAVVRHTGCNPLLAAHVLAAVTLARARVTTGDIVDAPSIRAVVAYVRALALLSPAEAWASCIAASQPPEGAAGLEAIRVATIDEAEILRLIGDQA